jgi:predicted DCC family thiol-disulfide oxidoreductase YuxK
MPESEDSVIYKKFCNGCNQQFNTLITHGRQVHPPFPIMSQVGAQAFAFFNRDHGQQAMSQ